MADKRNTQFLDYEPLGGNPIRVLAASHHSVSWHSHTFYELVYVREGYCLHHLGDSVVIAMEGDLLMIKPGVRHRYTGTQECGIYNCLFTADALDTSVLKQLRTLPGLELMFSNTGDTFPHIRLDMVEQKVVRRLLDQMAQESSDEMLGWQLKLKSQLCCLLTDCSRIYSSHGKKESGEDAYSGYVTRAMQYIADHYADQTLSVQGLGEYVGVSGDYLSRQFRKTTGIAVKEYIRRYRLSRAITSLQQGASVSEAASKNGFHSIGYFSREFKKEMGVTPSRYENG